MVDMYYNNYLICEYKKYDEANFVSLVSCYTKIYFLYNFYFIEQVAALKKETNRFYYATIYLDPAFYC